MMMAVQTARNKGGEGGGGKQDKLQGSNKLAGTC